MLAGMKTPRASRHRSSPRPQPVRLPAFKAFIAYADRDAARAAMRTIDDVLRTESQPHELHPMLWRIDQLCAARWHELALADAASAHIAVLASTQPGALSPELERWIAEFLARKRGTRVTLVALLGPGEAWTISIDQPLASVAIAAPAVFPAGAALTSQAA